MEYAVPANGLMAEDPPFAVLAAGASRQSCQKAGEVPQERGRRGCQ